MKLLGFRIQTLHAFVAKGSDNDEALVAAKLGGTWMPLIAADEARLEQLKPLAQKVAAEAGVAVQLVRFVRGQVVETYDGRKP